MRARSVLVWANTDGTMHIVTRRTIASRPSRQNERPPALLNPADLAMPRLPCLAESVRSHMFASDLNALFAPKENVLESGKVHHSLKQARRKPAPNRRAWRAMVRSSEAMPCLLPAWRERGRTLHAMFFPSPFVFLGDGYRHVKSVMYTL